MACSAPHRETPLIPAIRPFRGKRPSGKPEGRCKRYGESQQISQIQPSGASRRPIWMPVSVS